MRKPGLKPPSWLLNTMMDSGNQVPPGTEHVSGSRSELDVRTELKQMEMFTHLSASGVCADEEAPPQKMLRVETFKVSPAAFSLYFYIINNLIQLYSGHKCTFPD